MVDLEILEQEYLNQKKVFEDKEGTILFKRDQGLRDLEEIADKVHYYLKDNTTDQDLIFQALNGLDSLKEKILEAVQFDRKKLEKEWENIEEKYYRDRRQLTDKTSSRKESDL